ncbi:hypothetical protein V8G54_007825 [Vigna mungo]|uniref:F-box associated beta-propeller type 3 domain-containing protein n=1 Tax=Vigna mungo TaxID=3915 RepID=A0AAQ3P306_VIGMU
MLPVKSLVRFKCVCKSWLCLISDPHFAISHFQRLSASSTRLGFGYDPSTDDYLVVKASYNPMPYKVFSLRTSVWRDYEATHLSYMNYSRGSKGIREGSLLNGAIHWLAFCCNGSMDVIVVFDLTERSFSEWDQSVKIWVMEEYRVQSSWTKTIVVSAENIPAAMYFFPIYYTKDGDIFGTDGWTGLAKYNGKGQLQEHRSYSKGSYRSQVAVYTESLLSFPM